MSAASSGVPWDSIGSATIETMADLRVSIGALRDIQALGKEWKRLQECSDHSYFLSWGWIGCWLRELPERDRPDVVMIRNGREVVGLALAARRRSVRWGVIWSDGFHLNETGNLLYDIICIDYNGVLADRRMKLPVWKACILSFLDNFPRTDEFYFSNVNPLFAQLLDARSLRVEAHRRPCRFVDLERIRAKEEEYLSALKHKSRYNVQSALRRYEKFGPLRVEEAASEEEALQFFENLGRLHQAHWVGRGEPGCFSYPFFGRFHRSLIERRFRSGEIQLLRVSAGDMLVGYLYNIAYRGRVYQCQSGLNYQSDSKLSPGYAAACLAIQHNLAKGASSYDFMSADTHFKRTLGTDSVDVAWVRIQRRRLKYRFEDILKKGRWYAAKAWRALRKARSRMVDHGS